jgi:hypothetical protein
MAASGSRGMLGLNNLLDTAGASGGGGALMPPCEQLLTSAESYKRLLRLPHTRESAIGFDQLFFDKITVLAQLVGRNTPVSDSPIRRRSLGDPAANNDRERR